MIGYYSGWQINTRDLTILNGNKLMHEQNTFADRKLNWNDENFQSEIPGGEFKYNHVDAHLCVCDCVDTWPKTLKHGRINEHEALSKLPIAIWRRDLSVPYQFRLESAKIRFSLQSDFLGGGHKFHKFGFKLTVKRAQQGSLHNNSRQNVSFRCLWHEMRK